MMSFFFLNIYVGLKRRGALLQGGLTELSCVSGSSGDSELHGFADEVTLVEFGNK